MKDYHSYDALRGPWAAHLGGVGGLFWASSVSQFFSGLFKG